MALILQSVLLALALGPPTDQVRIEACERVEVFFRDAREQTMAQTVGTAACQGLQKIGPLFGGFGRSTVTIRITSDMQSFRTRTGRPWYVSAVFQGDEIVTQPARSLRKLKNLQGTLAHELVHLLVRRAAGRNCPRWLDEGLAQWLAGQKSGLLAEPMPALPASRADLEKLESRLVNPSLSREQLKQDYRICLLMIDRLIDRVGERTLIETLGGLKSHPDPLSLTVNGKPLDTWIFHLDD